jgi:hypothetical protein
MLLRRLRAAGVLGLMWALLCAPFGIAIYLALAAVATDFPLSARDLLGLVVTGVTVGTIWGLASGLVFAAALAALERRGGVEHLSRRRVVGWGALSGAAFPIVVTAVTLPVAVLVADIVPILAIVGAGTAYGAVVGGGLLTAALGAKRIEGA